MYRKHRRETVGSPLNVYTPDMKISESSGRTSIPGPGSGDHRPYPAPGRPWVLRMQWHDLLFLHWRVPADALRAALPEGLSLDLHGGDAYLGVVPFRMADIAPRCVPALPGLSAFPELNVRTYVVADGRPGVWFFSLDATQRLAVRMARYGFHLPYFDADIRIDAHDDGWIRYESVRTHRGAAALEFRARYRPSGDVFRAAPGSLDEWLTERYCLYAATPRKLMRGEIHHAPWPLQQAECVLERNTLAGDLGIALDEPPVSRLFARRLDVVAWANSRVRPRRV